MNNNAYDIIIIGAGIIGAATAYELSKKGYRTINVDMLPAAGYLVHNLFLPCTHRRVLLLGPLSSKKEHPSDLINYYRDLISPTF